MLFIAAVGRNKGLFKLVITSNLFLELLFLPMHCVCFSTFFENRTLILLPLFYLQSLGPVQKIGFLLITRKVSQLGYMLPHKLYINLAIVVIFTLFSSLSDLSMKICLIRRGPSCILSLKISRSKYLLLNNMF